MVASLFRVNYVNGKPDLDSETGDIDSEWGYWAEEEVSSPNQPQVLMHIESTVEKLTAMKEQPARYEWIEDVSGWPGMEEPDV